METDQTPTQLVSGLRLAAAPSHRPQLVSALRAWANGVRTSPGCVKVTLAEQVDDPGILYASVEWASIADRDAFRVSQLSRDLTRAIVPHIQGKPQTVHFHPDEVEPESEELSLA
jgi:quinol monooxygenase YgiN